MDLAFEDTELLTEGENLDLERGLALGQRTSRSTRKRTTE
jgi:hypothetical protein